MLEKIAVVAGDVSQEGFGLSPADLILLVENVSVVFNLAATGILKSNLNVFQRLFTLAL